ncbi:hypothetical protein HHX47_DHR8000142 [Lentinula edodes]|nr:hypothetical protein HHX47_DHR8000142 [Lentinula edodes]
MSTIYCVWAFYNPSKSGGIEVLRYQSSFLRDVLTMQPSQRIVSQMLLRQTPTSPLRHICFGASHVLVLLKFIFIQETLHQGAIEDIFLDNMRDMGVEVSRPVIPTSLEVTEALVDDFEFFKTEIGAHSWVRKSMGIAMQEEQTEYVWGVVDLVPDTDFPDIRNKCPIHSNNGSCMIIPREDDKIRLYIQLDGKDVIDASGRVDKSKAGPEMILDVARKTLHPFTIKTQKSYDWWTIYVTIRQRFAEPCKSKDQLKDSLKVRQVKA